MTSPSVIGTKKTIQNTWIQSQQTVVTSSPSMTLTTTPLAVPGLSVTITPTSASNFVLIMVNLSIGTQAGSSSVVSFLQEAGSNLIVGTSTGSRIACTGGFFCGGTSGDATTWSFAYMDSPSTTSPVTYSIKLAMLTGTQLHFVNRTFAPGITNATKSLASNIIAIEIPNP